MKKTLTAICAAVLLLGCLLTLPTPTEAAKATTSATTSQKVRITKQPASASVFTGSKIKVKVTAKGTGLKYKWYYKDKKSKSYKLDKSITGSTYNRKMTKAMDGRKIYCKITDKYGNTVKSKTVTLKAMVKAKITTQPKSVKVYAGAKGTVKVKAVGDQLIYKWYYKDKGSKSYKIDKAVSGSTYNRTMTKAMNGRKVYCKITDQYGNTVKSKTVTITVRNKATIVKQPVSTAVYSGESASVKIKATGDGLTYTWYYKNAGASSFKKVTSMKGTTYKTKMSTSTDGRQVYCLVKDKYGNKVKTKTVTLSTMVTATITKQPANAGVYLGAAANVSVTATGDGIQYQWFYKDTGVSYFQTDSAYKSSTYNRPMTASMNGRQVYCRITDQYGNIVKSNAVTLTLKNKATITKQPANDSVYAGGAATVSVTATGDGITYKWYYKDGSASFKVDTGITGSTYNRAMTSAMNGRQVYCKVTDKYGNSATSATVTITVKNKATITKQPANVSAYVGSDFSVSVGATGDGLSYKWYWRTSSTSGWQEGKVTAMVEGMTGWQVRCRVTDKYGNYVDSNPATLTAKVKAAITTQPVKTTVMEGNNAKFTVVAKGDGATYQWEYKDAGMSSFEADDNAKTNTYTFTATAAVDGRQVRCKVTDKYGNSVTSEAATLDVGVVAAILKQPQNIATELWQTVTVSFEAKGDGLTYQWYIKGKDDRNYTLTDVTASEYPLDVTIDTVGSQIYCVVSDSYGNKAATTPVTVTAPIPATILKQPLPEHYELGKPVEITFKAAGDGITYQWYHRSPSGVEYEKVTNNNTSLYRIGNLTSDADGRRVYCTVTDKYGNSVDTDEVVISTKDYRTVYYGSGKDIFSVELVDKEFATTDLVDWSFTQVGKNSDGTPYGFAKENVIQAQANIRGLDFGDGTYLTKYANVTEADVEKLVGYMGLEGFTVNSRSLLDPESEQGGDVLAITLTGQKSNCTISYVKALKEMYVTASKTMVYSPLLQENNFSTQSVKIEGAQTKLHMLPADTGDCYVIQLKNGNFIVFDGDNSKTLPTILAFLKANTPEGKIPVVEAWFITHGHYDHCSWAHSVDASFADKVRVEGVYFNQTAQQNWEQTNYLWRSDTATTGWRDKVSNPWPARVRPAVGRMKTASGETTKMYRPQTGQIYYFCGLQIEIAYCQEQINFCDYQMDLNASSTWYLVRSEEGNTFLDAGDTENVNMDDVIEMYSSNYDIYKENLDVMSIFHHGHNLYAKHRNTFRAPILFLPSAGPRSVNAEATTVYRYFTTKPGTYYTNSLRTDKENRWSSSSRLKDGLGLPVYHYGDGIYIYNFATGAVTKYS